MPTSVAVIGLGWLGSAFALRCREKGRRVVGTIRDPEHPRRALPPGIPVLPFCLGGPIPTPLCEPEGTTAFITISPSSTGMPAAPFENGLRRLAADLTSHHAVRIVNVSATAVYSNRISDPKETDAADTPSPRSGISLLRAENAIIEGAEGVPVITIRFGGLFGPGREPGRFFKRRLLRYPDDPVNLIHLDDCIGVLALAGTLETSQVINAVAPHHPERGLFYTAAALAVGEQPPMSGGAACSDAPKRINIDHLTKNLGYTFVHPNPLSLYY